MNDYPCTECHRTFLALFLLLEHMRKDHGQNLTPLAR